jgi:DNA polymerase-3 subunit delta
MKQLTVSSFSSYLNQPDYGHQYLLYGDETYFFDRLLSTLIDKTFDKPEDKDLNFHLFYGTDSQVSDILSACLSYPMMAQRKLVVVKEFDHLMTQNKESMLKYLSNPQPTTTLALVTSKWGNTPFHQQVLEKCISIQCRRLRDNEIYDWVRHRFKAEKIDIDDDAIVFLVENIGHTMQRLDLEIDKLIYYIKPAGLITLSDISQVTGFTREVNIFSLQNELAGKKLKKSMTIGMRLLEQGESLAALLPLLFIFFRRMWFVKELMAKNYNQKQILEKVSGNAYLYKEIFANSNRFTTRDIMAVLELLESADLQFKTSQRTERSILTMLCYQICSKNL